MKAILLIISLTIFSFAELVALGEKAPAFALQNLSGKRDYLKMWCGDKLLKPYKNKVKHTVIIAFWATYCQPCMKEIPELLEFMKEHPDDDLKLFCINIEKKSRKELKAFQKEKGWDAPILLDPYQVTSKKYGVTALPALFIISPDGEIIYNTVGLEEGVDLKMVLEKEIFGSPEEKEGVKADSLKADTVAVAQ